MENYIPKTLPKGTTIEQWERYDEDMKRWKEIYDPIRPRIEDYHSDDDWKIAFNKWCMDSAMSEPNKPGYYRANND